MIRQVRQQQMKCKERARQEKIVHRVQIVAAQRGQDKYQKEKEEQRHRSEIADPARQRTRLQLLRHLQGDVEAGHQILIVPFQLPAIRRLPLLSRGERIVREIKTRKIRFYEQVKVARLRDLLPTPFGILPRSRTLCVRA